MGADSGTSSATAAGKPNGHALWPQATDDGHRRVRDDGAASTPAAHGALNGRRWPAPAAVARLPALPQDEFVTDLHREMRRVERSKSALSLIVYRFAGTTGPQEGGVERLLERLHENKRETDILGHVDEHTLAVLCPDTGEAGLRAFIRKIAAGSRELPAPAAVTYPHDLFESIAAGHPPVTALGALLASGSGIDAGSGYALKRALDVCGAAFAIIALAPVWLAAAAAIALTSRGPVVFRQTRLGRAGTPFTIFKFRSMFSDNDDQPHREFVARLIQAGTVPPAPSTTRSPDDADAGASAPFKQSADPRVTPVGRFLRKTSIDELPQFINVLRGDMSLVGPRPPLAYEAAEYQAWHLRRILSMRPGITGLWQVEGRSRVSFNDMVRMDLRYLRGCSLAMDLKILLKTCLVVLRCDGAV